MDVQLNVKLSNVKLNNIKRRYSMIFAVGSTIIG